MNTPDNAVPADFDDPFSGYLMDKEGQYGDPIKIKNINELTVFLHSHVQTTHELRIVDKDDYCVFHVIDQTLIYPLAEGMSANNKWDSEKKKFVSVD